MFTAWFQQRSIDNHCRYLYDLMKRHPLDQDAREKIDNALRFVEYKRNDRNLNLAVVGEFSSGKSTFINALIRDKLLETDIIQGTTVASTIIRYAPSPSVVVSYKNGSQKSMNNETVPNLSYDMIKNFIKTITTNSALSASVQNITVYHPAYVLKGGMSIIDTPGTNSLERWHEDVTKSVIRDVADTSVVLTSAEQPLPDTLIQFIHENLEEVLEFLVFVITKMDLVREKEHDRQLAYIRQKITQEFGVENPVVLPYTPLFVLCDATNDTEVQIPSEKIYRSLIKQSNQSENQIFRLLEKNRIVIQIVRLLGVMENTFIYISDSMKALQSNYEARHAVLVAAQKRNLKEFVEETSSKYVQMFSEALETSVSDVLNNLREILKEEVDNIYSEFCDLSSQDEIKRFCNSRLKYMVEASGNVLVNEAHSNYNRFNQDAQDAMNAFWAEFTSHYSELKALDNQELTSDIKQTLNLKLVAPAIKSSAGEAMKALDDYGGEYVGAGLGLGAIIGTILLPGIGSVIGAGIGALLGGLFSPEPDIEKIKRETWQKLAPGIDNAFEEIFKVIRTDGEAYTEKLATEIVRQIAKCYVEYNTLVKHMIKQDEQEKKLLQKNVAIIQKDLNEIEARKFNISEARKKLMA